ncbi:hypothetical protein BJY04DRAFT_214767 [Aspergillus karnatakaensis]|uniref:uncharacterized protein n=1 Tax=Aspergillus karnatakaensis TaxID=1810916 RepID=UPI003CCD3865
MPRKKTRQIENADSSAENEIMRHAIIGLHDKLVAANIPEHVLKYTVGTTPVWFTFSSKEDVPRTIRDEAIGVAIAKSLKKYLVEGELMPTFYLQVVEGVANSMDEPREPCSVHIDLLIDLPTRLVNRDTIIDMMSRFPHPASALSDVYQQLGDTPMLKRMQWFEALTVDFGTGAVLWSNYRFFVNGRSSHWFVYSDWTSGRAGSNSKSPSLA